MAKPARRVQIVKNPAVGCPVEVGMSSASFDKDAHSFSNQEHETRSTEGCGQPAGVGGHRARPQERLPGLLQQAVSHSKEDQRSLSCDKPVHTEQTSHHSPFPYGDGTDGKGCSSSGRMDGVYRHEGCLSPRTDEPICEKVSPILCQQVKVSIHVSTVQASNITQRIHQAPTSCIAVPEVTRGPSSRVSRWLVDQGGLSTGGNVSCTVSHQSTIVLIILIFWDVNEKHMQVLINSVYQYYSIRYVGSCVFLFVVWDLLGKELTHICLCLWVIKHKIVLGGDNNCLVIRHAFKTYTQSPVIFVTTNSWLHM